ncbi:MAG: hypothetical protein M1828_004891 [Chrysothrix sp. TS-e1954]|nr:MAG: hypothetical protein M1828_004891 [Chrysothrix sp. TS-e1954]
MTSLPQPTRTTSAPTTSTSTNLDQPPVRRNLFPHANPSRRPAAPQPALADLGAQDAASGDILARDESGQLKMDILLESVPPETEEDKDEDAERAELKLRAAVQKSLREKVASLDDDKWMFELDDDTETLGG